MQQNDHFTIAGLVERVLDVVVQNINLVSANARVLKPIDVGFKHPREPLLDNVGPDVQVLELGVAFALINDQLVLLDQVGLFLLFGLPRFILLLDVLDQPKCSVQVSTWSVDFSWLFHICASVGPGNLQYITR